MRLHKLFDDMLDRYGKVLGWVMLTLLILIVVIGIVGAVYYKNYMPEVMIIE